MQLFFKTVICTAAFMAMSHAGASWRVDEGLPDSHAMGPDIAASSQLTFSSMAMSIFTQVAPLGSLQSEGPAKLMYGAISRGPYTTGSISSPVDDLGFEGDGIVRRIRSLSTSGGLRLTPEIDQVVTSGGMLSITNLTVDTDLGVIYGDLAGNNGVVALNHFQLFTYADRQGALDVDTSGPWRTTLTFTGLGLTSPAIAYFNQALGIYPSVSGMLGKVTDFGTLTFNVAAVPEPSTTALMGIGLVALGVVSRRRVRRQA
jgi:hypothetical protein